MSEHDEFCPQATLFASELFPCLCALISHVRTDERVKASQRVAADIRANNGCYDLGETHIEDICAAARGEDTSRA